MTLNLISEINYGKSTMTKKNVITINCLILLIFSTVFRSAFADEPVDFQTRVKTVLGIGSSTTIGTDEADHEAFLGLHNFPMRGELIETIIARGEAVDLGVEISYYHSHVFFKWAEGGNGVVISIYAQIGLDKSRRLKSVKTTITKRPYSTDSKVTTMPSLPLQHPPDN